MKNNKKFIIAIILLLLVVLGLIFYNIFNNRYLKELNVEEVVEKIDNNESFILCISQTICEHCKSYKPKLKKVAQEYDLQIFYIDVDKYSQDEINEFKKNISFDGSTPVTAFIVEGEESSIASRLFGDVSSDKIVNKLKNFGFID